MSECEKTIEFVGTGNAWSKPPHNFNTNALIRSGQGTWLLDCGLLCPLGLHSMGISPSRIDGVFITHLHGDHALGLEELFFQNYFAFGRRVELWLPEAFTGQKARSEGSELWENCLRGSMETAGIDGHLLELSDYAVVHSMREGQVYEIFGVKCEIFSVLHVPCRPSFGVILNDRTAYTSDCQFSRERIESLLNRGVETIFHEVTFSSPHAHPVHTFFEELSSLPDSFARHIILMHYEDTASEEGFMKAEDKGFRIARRGIRYSI